jgi:RNA polymerase sigma factor (sigma-70 family)
MASGAVGVWDQSGTGGATDGQLLARFVDARDEGAFAALVRRHGPTVLGVCRRVARNPQDADDAFQATFLVLVRKARSLARPELLGNWLYGVAYRAARKANADAARRREQGLPKSDPAGPDPASELHWRELCRVLDAELRRLPEKYRLPFVLCSLEGKTHEEVAGSLGCPRETVSTRVARARERLRARLTRRGVALSAGALAALVSRAASAAAPEALVGATVRAAAAFGVGRAAAAGSVSAGALKLTEGVLRTMLVSKLKWVAVLLLALVALGVAGGSLAARVLAPVWHDTAEAPPAKPAGDLDRLQGTWEIVSAEHGGRQVPEEHVKGATLQFRDKTATLSMMGQTQTVEIELHPDRDPKAIDMTETQGGEKLLHLGIYKLEGDTLTVCKSHPPQERPTKFATEGGGMWPALFVLKKQK